MQDHPRAPGTARQGPLGTDGPAACGGAAALSPAPGPPRPCATPLPLPMALDQARSSAASLPMAPDQARSGAASLPLPNVPGHADRDPAWAGPRVPLSTIPWPAGVRRLLSAVLHRVLATPGTRPAHSSTDRLASAADPVSPAQPVPPRPPPTTAGTGYPRHHHSRAPPGATRRKPTLVRGAVGGPGVRLFSLWPLAKQVYGSR